MEHKLPALPFAKTAFAPLISAEAMEFHYEKHHQGYVTKLNELIKGTDFENLPLEEIILNSEGPLFNNAAQVWNHNFFWQCLSPQGDESPEGKLAEMINKKWISLNNFKSEFTEGALNNFGSGWTWLILNPKQDLEIYNTSNADTPMTAGYTPLMTVDVWEHAYYIDYRNSRVEYMNAFWNLVNWEYVAQNLDRALNSILTFQKGKESDIQRA